MPKWSRRVPSTLFVAVFVLASIVPIAAVPTGPALGGSILSFEIHPAQLIVNGSSAAPTCATFELCPSMLATAYGFDALGTNASGTNQTVVIVDACGDPSIRSDLATFDSQFRLPAPPSLKVIHPQGTPCVDGSWATETALDVEWAHVTAPNARIALLEAAVPDPADMYGAWNYTIQHKLGSQISDSWGGAGCYANPACNNTIGQGIGSCDSTAGTLGVNVTAILTRAAKAGITVLAAAGDSGAWGQGTTNTPDPLPADCAGALTVGGTTLSVNSTGAYRSERAWSDGGGGYLSQSELPYQKSAKIHDTYHALAKPDVAADADPNSGVWVYQQGWFPVGGTSLACPLWAGFMADVNEIRANHLLNPAGFVNPFLYTVVYGVNGSSTLYASEFHDITSGNNGWPARTGWDAATGLGSFRVPALANSLGTNSTA